MPDSQLIYNEVHLNNYEYDEKINILLHFYYSPTYLLVVRSDSWTMRHSLI